MRSGRCVRTRQDELPEDASLLRQWKRWEAGETMPSEFYQPIIAKTFGTVTHAMFPVPPRRDANAEIVAASGMDTLELVAPVAAFGPGRRHAERGAGHGRHLVLGVRLQACR